MATTAAADAATPKSPATPAAPASSLTDKEREAIAQMPYEEAAVPARRGPRQARRRPGRTGHQRRHRWYSVQPGLSRKRTAR